MKDRVQSNQSESFRRSSRRRFLKSSAVLAGVASACSDSQTVVDPNPGTLGVPASAYGQRSEFEASVRQTTPSSTPEAGASRTPLDESYGVLTPSSLHFERHHAGVPRIDPAQHRLLIHGMVDRPLILTMEEILRLPQVSRIHFIECSGNSGSEWANPRPNPQGSHGMVGGSEWTGVPLSTILREVGVRRGASWILAEGSDAAVMARSIPLDKVMDDASVNLLIHGHTHRPATHDWECNGQERQRIVLGDWGDDHGWLVRWDEGSSPVLEKFGF